jgi:hypothetical protein
MSLILKELERYQKKKRGIVGKQISLEEKIETLGSANSTSNRAPKA